jgi:hypothetical protein
VTTPPGVRWRDGLVPVTVGWLVARLCVAMGHLVARPLGEVLETPRGDHHLLEGLVTWDGTYYRLLAEQWYEPLQEAARFFPLYPALGRLGAPLMGGREDWALVVINNLAAFAGALVLWRLVVEVVGHREVAARSAWMVSVFPASFVLVFAYSEGLAMLLVAATLLALHRRAFLAAGGLGLLCALLRPVGGLVLVPIAVELYRARPRPSPAVAALAVAGPVAGLVGALLWINRTTGDFFLPVRIQQEIRGGFQDPFTRMLEPIGEVFTGNFRDVYNLGFMWLFVGLLVVAVKRRQPTSWLAYSAVSLVLLLSSQVTDSLGRYGLVVVPFVVALAQWAERKWQQVFVATASCAGLVWLTSEAWLGRMVP